MKKAFPVAVAIIFILAGLLFITMGTVAAVNTFRDATYTTCTITEIEEFTKDEGVSAKYRVWVEYERGFEIHKACLASYENDYYEGMTLEIYYLSDDYEEVYLKNSEYSLLLFSAVGVIAVVFGAMVLSEVKKGRIAVEKSLL